MSGLGGWVKKGAQFSGGGSPTCEGFLTRGGRLVRVTDKCGSGDLRD